MQSNARFSAASASGNPGYADEMVAVTGSPEAEHYLHDLEDLNSRLQLAYMAGAPDPARDLLGLDAMPLGRDENSRKLLERAVFCYVGRAAPLDEVVGPRARAQGLCSLLHLAVRRGYYEIARLLLLWGADPDDSDQLRRSALHMAAARGDWRAALLLLEHGADPLARHFSGKTAVHFACEGSDDDALVGLLLASGLGLNDIDRIHRNTPLHLAAKGGRMRVARLLLARGADLNARNAQGSTPVHLAVANNRMLELFLERDPNLARTDSKRRTPLHLIVSIEGGAMVVSHLVMKEAVTGIPMDKANADYMERQPNWRIVRDECLQEIEQMKKFRCYKGRTCFEMYAMSVAEMAKRVKPSRRLALIWHHLHFEKLFPYYGSKLYEKFDKAAEARKHAHRVAHYLQKALGDVLPNEVTQKIGQYLRPQDIRFK